MAQDNGIYGPIVGGKKEEPRIIVPTLVPGRRTGMGDINDAYDQRYEQFKGQMPASPKDQVYAAPFVPCVPPEHQWILSFVESMKCQFEAMMRSVIESTPVKSIPPPYLAPPFTEIPLIAFQQSTVVAAATPAFNELIGFEVASKTTLMLTGIGIDAESTAALSGLLFRLRFGGRVVPLFSASGVPAGQFQGTFNFPCGTIANPLNLREYGVAPLFRGPGRFSLDVASNDAVLNHTARGIVTTYSYPNQMAGQEEDGQMSTVCGGSGTAGG